MPKGWIKPAIAIPAALVVLAVGGPWVYINLIKKDAPDRLTVNTDTSATSSTTAATNTTETLATTATTGTTATTAASSASSGTGVGGTWNVTTGSLAGYRIKEVLFGQSTEAVGRTSGVTGQMVIDGTTIKSGTFTVDMKTIASNESRRDNRYRDVMAVSTNPTSTFKLTKPITVSSLPAEGTEVNVKATGELTLKGTTKTVTLDLTAKKSGNTVRVAGSYNIVFDDWGIQNPSFGPATTEDHGEMEFLLVLRR